MFGFPTRFGLETALGSVKVHDVAVAGPRDAVERVWRDDGPRLWRSLVAFGGDQELASDAMAEAFAQALGRGAEVEAPDRWIWRAAFRIAAGELKERGRVAASDVLRASVDMPDSVADLVRALRTLSPNQRGAAVLSLYADMSTRDVARTLGCSQATVRVHLSQARRRLRALLEETDE
jgi:RNA polymerase sigma factor (sigma-70 family)